MLVESEDQPDRVLLDTRVGKEDGFHKQQGTLGIGYMSLPGVVQSLTVISLPRNSNRMD